MCVCVCVCVCMHTCVRLLLYVRLYVSASVCLCDMQPVVEGMWVNKGVVISKQRRNLIHIGSFLFAAAAEDGVAEFSEYTCHGVTAAVC